MAMSERARLAGVPRPVPGLNCPRCESTNTKFCYFNNYSLTQPRHFCRACRRYWTRGGDLRNVPIGGYHRHRHAKRTAKPTAASAAKAIVTRTPTTPSITAGIAGMATAPSGLQYSMFGSAPLLADCFDPQGLGLRFPDSLLFVNTGAYVADDGGDHHHHHQGSRNDVEQRAAVQMHNHPFLHTMSVPPAAAIPTTMVAMHGTIHLGLLSGGRDNGEEGGGHHQSMIPAKADHHQQQQNYPSSRSMYGDIADGGGGGYNFYSRTSY